MDSLVAAVPDRQVPPPAPRDLAAVARAVLGGGLAALLGSSIAVFVLPGLPLRGLRAPAEIATPPPPIARGIVKVSVPTPEPVPSTLDVRSVRASDFPAVLRDSIENAIAVAESGELAQAEMAYRDTLLIGRDDPRALAGLTSLRQRYQDTIRAEIRFTPIRDAFRREDFRAALGLLYRLPADTSPERARRATVNGWYDLAVVALRAGRCDEAARNLAEAAAVSPRLGIPAGASALAARCAGVPKDLSYLNAADALRFRGMDE